MGMRLILGKESPMPEMPEIREFSIEYHLPDEMASSCATNLLVQHTDHEFVLSFFEARLPPSSGEPDEIDEQIKELRGKVRAECVARITVAASRMPEFVDVLQKNLEAFGSRGKVEK